MAEAPDKSAPAEAPAPSGGGLMSGLRGWIIAIGVVVIEAVFFLVLMSLSPTAPEDNGSGEPDALPAAMQDDPARMVVLEKLAYVLQGVGPPMELMMSISLVFNYTEQEKREPKAKGVPPASVLEAYQAYAESSTNYLKNHLNSFMQGLDPAALRGAVGQQRVREEIKNYMNGRLQEFVPPKAPPGMDRQRVTDVLLQEWLGPKPME